MNRTVLLLSVIAGLVVVGGLGFVLAWPRAPMDSAPNPSVPAARLVCYGYVDSREGPLILQPTRAGRVNRVFVKEKQTLSKDTPLVQIDDRVAKLQEDEAELGVKAAKLQFAKARDGLKQFEAKKAQVEGALEAAQNKVLAAQHYLTVKENLLKDGFANDGQVDLLRRQVDEARILEKVERNKLAELKAVDPDLEVKLAQALWDRSLVQLERARQDREEYVMKSPVDGVVLRVAVQVGDLVSPTSARPALWVIPKGALIVRAEVSQEFAERVLEGLPVQVEDEASSRFLGKGIVAEVSDWFLPRRQFSLEPTGINTGLALECVIALEDGNGLLRLGQRVRVRVLSAGKSLEQPPPGP